MRKANPYVKQAEENGIKKHTYYARRQAGWSKERASTQPPHRKYEIDDEIVKKAEKKNIPIKLLRQRLKNGWSTDEATTIPLNHYRESQKKSRKVVVYSGGVELCKGTVKECAKKLGVRPATIQWMTNPSYHKRIQERQTQHISKIAFRVNDDES